MAYLGYTKSDQLKQWEQEERERECVYHHSTNGCYLFVMFPSYIGSNVHEVGKACVLAKRTVATLGGRLVGIARKVFSFGFDSKSDEGCIVFQFPNRAAAKMFFESDPLFKQPDFPPCAGHCQAWAIDRHYTPDYEQAFNTFMISEIRLKTPQCAADYKTNFATKFANLLLKYNAQPYVVQSTDCLGVRRFCKDKHDIVTVHLFLSPSNLGVVMDDPGYADLKSEHRKYADEMCSVFTIDPQPCP